MFLCWQHVQATRLGYRVESARKEAAEKRGRVATLRVELEGRLSPEQVAARAAKIGLIPAAPAALRRLPGGERLSSGGALARMWNRGLAPLVAAARS